MGTTTAGDAFAGCFIAGVAAGESVAKTTEIAAKVAAITVSIDNCVFYKRWTRPDEWVEKIASLGLRYIEASADTELDPLYMGQEYLNNWVNEVKLAQEKHGVQVCNLYS